MFTLYVGTYYRLSRRGMAEAEAFGLSYFLYCPVTELSQHEELPWYHYLALWAFDPINRIDRAWFGGGEPCRCILWGLSR
jgi:hypothetical protein